MQPRKSEYSPGLIFTPQHLLQSASLNSSQGAKLPSTAWSPDSEHGELEQHVFGLFPSLFVVVKDTNVVFIPSEASSLEQFIEDPSKNMHV